MTTDFERALRAWAICVLGLIACDAREDKPSGPAWTRPAQASEPETKAPSAAQPSGRAEPGGPIERAETKLYFPAKGSTNFGFNLEALSKLYALEGAIEIPSWSAAGEDEPSLMRDDDISTAWRCTPTEKTPCALGLRFPAAARFEALRFFAVDPAASKESLRITKVRVHTDEGFVDVPLPEDPTHLYVVLGQPVVTTTLAVEVLETRGKSKGPVHVAELEVYGSQGERRAPWNIDPRRTIVRLAGDPWTKGSGGWKLRSGTLELVEDDGSVRRLSTGTALLGQAGDRMLLLERIEQTSCDRHEGTYFLVDQQTRVIAPLGALGGAGADVYRHAEGMGFAVGSSTAAETLLHGVMLEEGEIRRKRTPARRDKRAPDTFEAWSLDPEPLRRGGTTPAELPADCALGSDDRLTELTQALGRASFEARPAQWVVCELASGARAFLTARAPCGSKWELHVLDANRTRVASHDGSGKGTHLRVERAGIDLLMAEVGQANGRSEVFRVASDAITRLGEGTSLALRPPSACRKACDDPLPNPHARSH